MGLAKMKNPPPKFKYNIENNITHFEELQKPI